VPKGEERVKVPAWLNDTSLYHNRGNSTFAGESIELGDFSGLDDLATEDPRVVKGFIDIFAGWIDRFHIDGYRIDTARHVNVEFWQAFVPAMLARAKADGIPNFHVFGEVATSDVDVPYLARYTKDAKFPAVLDFGFANAVRAVVAGGKGTDVLARLFEQDALYEGGANTALQLPTFISNHDMGRFAWFVRSDQPQASDDEVMKRVMLANAMLFTLRGVPVVYYGDEQGFAGTGNDQDARQDMFATQVAVYRADKRLGVGGGPSETPGAAPVSRGDSFDRAHPLYRAIAELAALRVANEPLRRGKQIVRASSDKPGVFAVSRVGATGQEIVVAFNTSTEPLTASFDVNASSKRFRSLHGSCAASTTSTTTAATGVAGDAASAGSARYSVSLPPLDFVICSSGDTR
jgi:glycosidase